MSSIIINHMGQNITGNYNELNIESEDEIPHAVAELITAQDIGLKLMKHYPGREWGVRVDNPGGMIILTCPSLSHMHGYYLPMYNDSKRTLQTRAVMACGQILERYNVSRNRKFDSDILETLPRDFQDEVISADAMPLDIVKGMRS